MLRTNILRKIETLTFKNNVSKVEYRGKTFETIKIEGQADSFIDWINGGIKTVGSIGEIAETNIEWDTGFLNRAFTDDLETYVQQKLAQKLNIVQGEIDYKFENTEMLGIPYLDKLLSEELDLFIKDAIISTVGVKELTQYKGEKKLLPKAEYGGGKEIYSIKFEVVTEEGEKVWQSIEI